MAIVAGGRGCASVALLRLPLTPSILFLRRSEFNHLASRVYDLGFDLEAQTRQTV